MSWWCPSPCLVPICLAASAAEGSPLQKGGQRDAARELGIGTTLAENGYVGLSIDYLLSNDGHRVTWPQNLHDCKTAVRWLRKNADRLRVDPDHIGVIGGSAGGHLSAMVA